MTEKGREEEEKGRRRGGILLCNGLINSIYAPTPGGEWNVH